MGKKPSSGKAAPHRTGESDITDRIIDAMLDLAAAEGWRGFSLHDIAGRAAVPLSQLHPAYLSKESILAAFLKRIDRQVLAGTFSFTEEDSPRDRLFEVLMRRFDTLQPHREAVRRIRGDLMRTPLGAAKLLPTLGCSVAWMLEAAGIGASGPAGRVKVVGVTGIWLKTMATWVDDDTEDMSRTMAALDRNLARVGTCATVLFRGPFGRRRAAA